jgi:uncharacterized protein with von Willebrand factor type A (vWA) domain
MNVPARGKRFCIITDNSGSMKGEALAKVQREMVWTLQQIPPDCQFFVLFFNSKPVPMPHADWLNGGPASLKRVVPWIGSVRAGGDTQPTLAFEVAFRLNPRPDAIFFLTDGLMPTDVPGRVVALNDGRPKVPIHTLMIVGRSQPPGPSAIPLVVRQVVADNPARLAAAQKQLQRIALESGGTYRLVAN